jgi:serine phosphatase RsbU (regulator of sigma subunit)/tetratricopeptide (TPR) repeat protein
MPCLKLVDNTEGICKLRAMRKGFISKLLIFVSVFFIGQGLNAQNEQFENYLSEFHDWEYSDNYIAKQYLDSAESLLDQISDPKLLGDYDLYQGWYYQDLSKYEVSREWFFKALDHYKEAGAYQNVANAYGNIGNAYFDIDDLAKSLEYHQKSILLNEQIAFSATDPEQREGAEKGKAYAFTNVASVYLILKEYDKSLKYQFYGLHYEESINDSLGMAISYQGIGDLYEKLGKKDSAYFYLESAKRIFKNERYTYGLTRTLMAMAQLETDSTIARGYLLNALDLAIESQESRGQVGILGTLIRGGYDLPSQTLKQFVEDLRILQEDKVLTETSYGSYLSLAQYYYRERDFKESAEAYKEYLNYDQANQIKNQANNLKSELVRNELQLKSVSDSLRIQTEFAQKSLEDERKISNQKTIITIAIAGGVLMLGLLFFLFKNIKTKNLNNRMLASKNQRIQDQKEIVDEKNKQITDSINYAKRLQGAILPPISALHDNLKEAFVLFKPKDVVSGDFYWFEQKDDLVFIAAADCTGHGVPGAMVSVVCANALNRVVNEFDCKNPNEILDKTRDIVVATFARSGEDVKDGMDISLCVIDKKQKLVSFSGANNPLWIVKPLTQVRDNEISNMEVNENCLLDIKGDKQPIGLYAKSFDFTTKDYSYSDQDTFYIFTDGYADQFGGGKGKKLKYKTLKKLLLDSQNQTLSEQHKSLDQFIVNWMGDFEQLDDICVIGFKP